jgi:3-deoxy-manno-octulosonate cytidylyltransferase (CMP-KDO synthetase)
MTVQVIFGEIRSFRNGYNQGETFMAKIICVIPSRYQSSRFPGKPLADLCGKPMIQHVYERALRAGRVALAIVATDDERIFRAVENFGGKAVMTSESLRSGTDRIAAAVENIGLAEDDIVVNIQGDQPLFEPTQIDEVVAPLLEDAAVPMATLIYRIIRDEEIVHPNAVKVVFDINGFALYFSRATIPFVRDKGKKAGYFKHHGIYAYRRDFLRVFANLPEGTLERLESLEQLRALEHGYRIRVAVTEHDSVEVDTPEELARVGRIIRAEE